jgi:hypothetical protein
MNSLMAELLVAPACGRLDSRRPQFRYQHGRFFIEGKLGRDLRLDSGTRGVAHACL